MQKVQPLTLFDYEQYCKGIVGSFDLYEELEKENKRLWKELMEKLKLALGCSNPNLGISFSSYNASKLLGIHIALKLINNWFVMPV